MAKIIGVISTKGGVGKTTLAMLLADALDAKGYKVLVIDLDPQRSAWKWEGRALQGYMPFPVKVESMHGLSAREVAGMLQKRIDNVDYLILDSPPHKESPDLRVGLMLSDIVLVPAAAHVSSIDAFEEMTPLVKLAERERGEAMNVFTVINKYDSRRGSERVWLEHIAELSPWPVLKTNIKDLVQFANASNYRTSLRGLPKAKEAADTLDALIEELDHVSQATA